MAHEFEQPAVLFPGQGVGDAGDRELVGDARPDLLALSAKLVGDDPFVRLAEGTSFAQPAVYCAALAGFERLGRPLGRVYAGHSLGEITALAAAGAVDDHDGLRIVVARGRLMEEAAESGPPGGMLAVGGDREQATALAASHGLAVANHNSPTQFVLTGPDQGLEDARAGARELGLRAKRLAVAGAFHSEAMRPVVERFRERLAEVEFRPPRAPVLSCVTATPFDDDPRDQLAAALVRPVEWVAVLERLYAEGARRFLDVGPGRVLAGLVRRTLDGVEAETAAIAEPARA